MQRGFDEDEQILLEMAQQHTSPVFLMQRLDRGTSGVMFFSKEARVNPALTRFFERRRIQKRYLAICHGEIAEKQTIDAPLIRIGAIKFGVYGAPVSARPVEDANREPPAEAGAPFTAVVKRAVTHVEPITFTPQASLVAIHLETGRTHQIRVHMAAIGHPLVGDWLYGKRDAERPMLHSAELVMPHPLSGETLRVVAPPPADFQGELERLGLVPVRGQGAPSGVQLNY